MSCGCCDSSDQKKEEKKEMCPCGCGETINKCTCPPECECRKTTCK